jgi:hypothetical protein
LHIKAIASEESADRTEIFDQCLKENKMNKFASISKPLTWLMALLLTAVVTGCGGSSGSAPPTSAALVSIAVTPATASIPAHGTQQFVATATYSDSTTAPVTTTASWTSGAIGIATVGAHTGLAYGVVVSATPVVITATLGGKTATAAVTVTSATVVSIAVTPASAVLPVYGTQQFVATATYSDSTTAPVTTTASWTSGATGTATVGANTGIAAGVTTSGTPVVITASLSGKTATAAVTVNTGTLSAITVTPASAVIAVGGTQQFVATGTFSGSPTTSPVTTTASWTADASGNATVGLHTGLASGVAASGVPVTITAALPGKSATAALTVTAPPQNPTPPVLGEAGRFVILAYAGVTTTGTTAISNGDIGITPTARSGMAGFTPTGPAGDFAELTGSTWPGMLSTSYAPNDANPAPFPYPLTYASPHSQWSTTGAMLTQASTDETTAYNFLAHDPNPGSATIVCPTELGGQTLTRGDYMTASNVGITTGTLYLDAQGDPNAVWIFNISGTLTTIGAAPKGNIAFVGGVGSAKNVYWRVGGVTNIAASSTFIGNIFDATTIAVGSGANVTGSLFSANGSVTLIADTVTKP